MNRICIVAAKRTPQGRFMGALSKQSATQLAIAAGKAVLDQIPSDQIDQVIVGNVLSAGQGMNIARQIALGLGVPIDRIAFTVNMMCASGMQAVMLADQAIRAGQAKVILCGGTESMSNAPYLLDRARQGYKLGQGVLIDCLLRDGLVDSFSNEHMGLTAEELARRYKIDRAAQDEFALSSQQKYAQGSAQGRYDDELVPVGQLDKDEHPRPEMTIDQLASLQPAFTTDGTVTPGNASGINDGASMLIVCDEATARKSGYKPLAIIRGWAAVGCDPKFMGLGPVYATEKLCRQEQLKIDDFDTIEINEAFAVQTLACVQQLKIAKDRLNPDGGAIALGHPIGSSGARLVIHLAHRIARGQTSKGLAALCVGGGLGAAMVLEAV